jgi:hypothetical protein
VGKENGMKSANVFAMGVAVMAGVCGARAQDVIVNGGFEAEGEAGSTDSGSWIEIANGGEGTLSERVGSGAAVGSFAHRLVAVGQNGLGGTGVILQNSRTNGGLASLEQNTQVSAVFQANVDLGPGGVGFYTLRVLNGAGAIVASSGTGVITRSTNGQYEFFAMGPLTVPAFGEAPNDVYSAFVEIAMAAGAFPESRAEGLIDGVVVTGTLVSSCAADFNADGFLDFFDYGDFVTAFETGVGDADFNNDGFVDFFDYADFVTAFELGC